MAKSKVAEVKAFKPNNKVKRKGVHSKKSTSKLVTSKLYTKKYRGQGK
jgi:hypothetical protein